MQSDTPGTSAEFIRAETELKSRGTVAVSTPEDAKSQSTSQGPIAAILPTNEERLHTSIPIFAAELAKTAGELFPDPQAQSKRSLLQNQIAFPKVPSLKAPPVASIPKEQELSMEEERALAEEIFEGKNISSHEDSKPRAVDTGKDTRLLAEAMDIDQSPLQSNPDTIAQLNESIEKNKKLLFKLQEMLRALEASNENDGTSASYDANSASTIPPESNDVGKSAHRPIAQNQQRDPIAELATQKPTYPKLPEPSPKRSHFYRATWRISLPNDMESPVEGLIDGISEIWTVLKGIDDKMIIYLCLNFPIRRRELIGISRTRIFGRNQAQCI